MSDRAPIQYRQIFAIVIPTILSNITVPLVGMTDMAIMGWYNQPVYLAALTIGSSVFSLLFWAFGFLRMGITGSLGQIIDSQHPQAAQALIQRYMQMALVAGVAVWLLGLLGASWLLLPFDNGDAELMAATREYVSIRLWSAPFTLMNYVLLGTLLSFGNGKWLLIMQLALNLSNISLSWLLGWVVGWEIAGVAWGSVLAEALTVAIGVVIIHHQLPLHWPFQRQRSPSRASTEPLLAHSWLTIIQLNINIFIRTLLLTIAFAWFARESTMQATLLTAINGVMLKFVELFAYALDGYAFAVESLAAKAIGRRDWRAFQAVVKKSFIAAILTAIILSIVFIGFHQPLSRLITQESAVLAGIATYQFWVVAVIMTGVSTYLLDGLYLSASAGSALRNGMIFAFACYALLMLSLPIIWGNHGLWLALVGLMVARTVGLWHYRSMLYQRFDGDIDR